MKKNVYKGKSYKILSVKFIEPIKSDSSIRGEFLVKIKNDTTGIVAANSTVSTSVDIDICYDIDMCCRPKDEYFNIFKSAINHAFEKYFGKCQNIEEGFKMYEYEIENNML